MLPARLLRVHERGDTVVPRWLGARDEPWVRLVLDELAVHAGMAAGEVDRRIDGFTDEIARSARVDANAIAGLVHVLRRSFRAEIAAPVPPPVARRAAFEAAQAERPWDRRAALDLAAASLGIAARDLEASLFADRPAARKVISRARLPGPTEAVGTYNLALLQGLLLLTESVAANVGSHVRAVVRFAKLEGLLCTFALVPGGARVELSGPLSLFRDTIRYGRALARFVPSLISTPGWSLEGRCLLRGRPRSFVVSAADPVAATHALPRDADSKVERHLARDVARLGGPWKLAREDAALSIGGGRVFFPDFSLRRDDGARVLVEIVGFWTPEYLASKLRALSSVEGHRIVVAIDESLARDTGEVPASGVVRYRRRVDAAALIAEAERVVSGGVHGSGVRRADM